jgi:hypothetical protein
VGLLQGCQHRQQVPRAQTPAIRLPSERHQHRCGASSSRRQQPTVRPADTIPLSSAGWHQTFCVNVAEYAGLFPFPATYGSDSGCFMQCSRAPKGWKPPLPGQCHPPPSPPPPPPPPPPPLSTNPVRRQQRPSLCCATGTDEHPRDIACAVHSLWAHRACGCPRRRTDRAGRGRTHQPHLDQLQVQRLLECAHCECSPSRHIPALSASCLAIACSRTRAPHVCAVGEHIQARQGHHHDMGEHWRREGQAALHAQRHPAHTRAAF